MFLFTFASGNHYTLRDILASRVINRQCIGTGFQHIRSEHPIRTADPERSGENVRFWGWGWAREDKPTSKSICQQCYIAGRATQGPANTKRIDRWRKVRHSYGSRC